MVRTVQYMYSGYDQQYNMCTRFTATVPGGQYQYMYRVQFILVPVVPAGTETPGQAWHLSLR
eukprot:COSAG02_NODE_51715_length_312_cov_0.948357_1_plen_61_part_10